MEHRILQVVLDTPLHASFDYRFEAEAEVIARLCPGLLVIVPFGRREVMGLIVDIKSTTEITADKLKSARTVLTQLPPLSKEWLDLCRFAADYYQRPLGEVALPALPKKIREHKADNKRTAFMRALTRGHTQVSVPTKQDIELPQLNAAQEQAVRSIAQARGFAPMLLFGVTGSGKTEVYLRAAQDILAAGQVAGHVVQILILVPEINLTPQLQGHVEARFPHASVALLHSGLAEGERLQHWLAAHSGTAQILLGTRLAVLASIPHLKFIIVDEEHDASYKQQEGLRYSARDLAVWRARQLGIPVVLGSATPSLETWQHAQVGRYRKLELQSRAVADAVLPQVRLVDMERDKPINGMTATLLAALRLRLEKGEQSLLYLNRRGYAPVIHCEACGWVSNCRRCTAFMVLHKSDARLRCHHCSHEERIPKSCPTCGNVDLQPMGRGTQRLEEGLQRSFPQARILRIDADSTRLKGSAQDAFNAVHRGEVDILVGTQMVAKGHDFQGLSLVGVLNPDTALFSQDFRASERLFAQLMQVAGRAGRRAQSAQGNAAEVMIQTRYPQHPLYAALAKHDYERFARAQLEERRHAGLPPFMHQALLRAEAVQLPIALAFLREASDLPVPEGVLLHDPIPMTVTRVANVERAQLLVESGSRPALQAFLKHWTAVLRAMKTRVKWSLEVDPLEI